MMRKEEKNAEGGGAGGGGAFLVLYRFSGFLGFLVFLVSAHFSVPLMLRNVKGMLCNVKGVSISHVTGRCALFNVKLPFLEKDCFH